MFANGVDVKRLCWMQRIALVRHSLHAALRTNDFTFFKVLQAQAFLDGTDRVAILSSLLGGDVDTVLHTLDDLNAGLAYVHQDAFKSVYDSIRTNISEDSSNRRAKVRVDISQQKQVADFGIDKMANAAVSLIQEQDPSCQEAVANVWLFGATIITDAMQTVVRQMDKLEGMMDDFILLEYSWQMVQTATEAAVAALRGIFNLMASTESGTSLVPHRRERSFSTMSGQSRTTSVSSATGSLFKRLSTVLHASPVVPPSSARNSMSVENASPHHIRQSISHSFPTNVPMSKTEFQRKLSTIPPTPFESNVNPFDANFERYAAQDSDPREELTNAMSSVHANSPFTISIDDTMEDPSPLDCDPLASNVGTPADDCKTHNANPTWFRRLSRDLGPTPIAV